MSTQDGDTLSTLSSRVLDIIQKRTGLHAHLAEPIRDDIIAELRRNYASERIYIAAREPSNREQLKQLIKDEFNGTTVSREAFCQRYRISRRTFYRLCD